MGTRTPLASFTLDSAASSVTFSGIPQTYTDLVLVAAVTGVSVATDPWIRINSDTGTNYSWTWLSGNGSAASSERGTNNSKLYYSAISTIQNNVQLIQFNFMNYSNTTTYKTVLWRESDAGTETGATVGLWRSTSAINTLEISLDASRTYSAGTTFNLYGVDASLSAQAKATGGTSIYTDGTYWYHIFNQSGTFTPTQSLSNVDFLVVAGGGGGGVSAGGGGGAGGMRCSVTATGGSGALESKLSLSAQAYTVTVGAGGTKGAAGVVAGQGNSSSFSSISTIGGGRGGGSGANGGNGGSGGGAEWQSSRGFGSDDQGYAGGTGTGGSPYRGGGGGGASADGANGGAGAAGGAGRATSITGSSITYAGGGGGAGVGTSGGSGGSGGGGAGGSNSGSGVSGTAGLGGGGGGGGDNNVCGAGGSGVVVVRYAV